MRKTVPDFVVSRFQRVGSQNPVGVLTLVLSPKELGAFRDEVVRVATTARSLRDPKECPRPYGNKILSVHKYEGFPDLSLEVEISPEGWEIEFLIRLAGKQALEAANATPPRGANILWLPSFGEEFRKNTDTKPIKWAHSEADLFRCGEDWLISLVPVLQRATARALGEIQDERPTKGGKKVSKKIMSKGARHQRA